jgi:hypothetical protein
MKAKKLILSFGIIIVILSIFVFSMIRKNESVYGKYDEFAKCLTNNGVKMYGAYWCPHCNNQKKMFGDSWKYINYIECSLPNRAGQTEFCKQAGIRAYPTWEFKNGERIEGELTLEQLSQYSNCKLEV